MAPILLARLPPVAQRLVAIARDHIKVETEDFEHMDSWHGRFGCGAHARASIRVVAMERDMVARALIWRCVAGFYKHIGNKGVHQLTFSSFGEVCGRAGRQKVREIDRAKEVRGTSNVLTSNS